MVATDNSRVKSGAAMAAKLDDINAEILSIYQRATQSGLTVEQIQRAAQPLLSYIDAAKRPPHKHKLLLFLSIFTAISVAVIACLVSYDPTYRWLAAHARILSIKTLPYWDWSKYYNEECLVRNPYYLPVTEDLYEEDCQLCENIGAIERASNISQYVMAELYIKRDVPVIITDATDKWPARQLFNLRFLHNLYESEDALRASPPCLFTSNVRQQSFSVQTLLNQAINGQLTQWFAHWENCDHKTVRLMRRFYRRPTFLPAMVEAGDRSWMFLSMDYSTKLYKHVDMSAPLMWIAQLHGENRIRLTPRQPCNTTCTTLYAVLHEGDTIVWTDFLWLLDYVPIAAADRLNVAIGSAGTFD